MSLLRRDFLISGAEGLENEIIAWPTSRRAILLNIFLPRINRRWPGEEGEGGEVSSSITRQRCHDRWILDER